MTLKDEMKTTTAEIKDLGAAPFQLLLFLIRLGSNIRQIQDERDNKGADYHIGGYNIHTEFRRHLEHADTKQIKMVFDTQIYSVIFVDVIAKKSDIFSISQYH